MRRLALPLGARHREPFKPGEAMLGRAIRVVHGFLPGVIMLCLLLPLTAEGVLFASEQRFPPPEFTIDYTMPLTEVVQPHTTYGDWTMFGAMVLLLVAATYLAIARRSRRGLLIVAAVSIVVLGFWSEGCVCPIGSIQNVALALFDRSYAIPLTVLGMFSLPLIIALFFGRTFCSGVCPFGAMQELVAVRPVPLPRWIDDTFGLFRYVYLGLGVLLAATGGMWIICRYDPFVGLFRFGGDFWLLLTGGLLLLGGVFIARPYCRFLCPLGGLLTLCSRVANHPTRITPDVCVSCRLCEDACPYNAIREPSVAPSEATRRAGRARLAVALAMAPLLLLATLVAGYFLAEPISLLHPVVQTANIVRMEELGLLDDTTPTEVLLLDAEDVPRTRPLSAVQKAGDVRDAFRSTGRSLESLYAEAVAVRGRFRWGGLALGAWLGLVFSGKWIQLATRRKRSEYGIDAGRCFACGRCFMSCPVEHVRRGLIQDLGPFMPPVEASENR